MRSLIRHAFMFAVLCWAGRSYAQGTARSQDIDTSIRAAGMGATSVAVMWGTPGIWGNPASMAQWRGLGWVSGHTRLVPDLADDVTLRSQHLLVGGAGVGVAFSGKPIDGWGFTELDYGATVITDPFGTPIGIGRAHEHIDAWALGVSPVRLLDALRGHADDEASWARLGELAFGLQFKHTNVDFSGLGFGGDEADAYDWGVQGRVAVLPITAPVSLDLAVGRAVLGADDQFFPGLGAPGSRMTRTGVAVHAVGHWQNSSAVPWWQARLERSVSLGVAFDHEAIGTGSQVAYEVDRFGAELTLLGVASLRVGHVSDREGDIVGPTYGAGLRLPVGDVVSLGFDWASVPEATGLSNVKRAGFTVTCDPMAMIAMMRKP